ncbi:phosphotransferase family protein [Shimia ponticola]|uniref:phosphotransferase family protein n=1 Tax=Shimia ponticola TaxID=2582893 RepID=UPI00164B0684|nr:aminoglycoside phosphotransferase family protein [Shimia ponticola]
MTDLEARCATLIEKLRLGRTQDITRVTALTGGVASDIARVDLKDRTLCVKFALPKLRVQADWYAPVHRSAAEYAWLQVAASASRDHAVQLFGRSDALHGFAMEFIAGPDVYLWKDALLSQASDQGEAAALGDTLGRVHAASVQEDFDIGPFQNQNDFRAIRIEPYLSYTAQIHSALTDRLDGLASDLYQASRVLVHGDVSPKNILFRGGSALILDAECATMGDPAFDPAFCLNHLTLKALHLPTSRSRLLANTLDLWRHYRPHVCWEDPSELEARVCALLPALMLARVDGKSPVEYLSTANQNWIRQMTPALILNPKTKLQELVETLGKAMA